jgi:hypothetical protein
MEEEGAPPPGNPMEGICCAYKARAEKKKQITATDLLIISIVLVVFSKILISEKVSEFATFLKKIHNFFMNLR